MKEGGWNGRSCLLRDDSEPAVTQRLQTARLREVVSLFLHITIPRKWASWCYSLFHASPGDTFTAQVGRRAGETVPGLKAHTWSLQAPFALIAKR